MLTQINIEEIAIARIKEYYSWKPYYVAFSGGKDSEVMLDLVRRSGVPHEAIFHFTTVDPPELIAFVRSNYPNILWTKPKKSMFQWIEKKGFPPTRNIRYCCEKLKEFSPPEKGRIIVTGVRWEESIKRSQRPIYEENYKGRKKTFLHPIIDWSTEDVWSYIRKYKLPYCKLYDEGFDRIGCIMCPLQKRDGIVRDAKRYPKYYRAYMRAFERAIKAHPELTEKSKHKTPEEMMYWWINGYEQSLKSRQNILSKFGVDIDDSPESCSKPEEMDYL